MRPSPLVTGDDLIAAGHVPGPKFREILTAVEDAQLEGRLLSRDAGARVRASRVSGLEVSRADVARTRLDARITFSHRPLVTRRRGALHWSRPALGWKKSWPDLCGKRLRARRR